MTAKTTNETTFDVQPGQLSVGCTREFEAPVDLLFRVYTEGDMVSRWMGPRNLKMRMEAWDARPGGSWRYVSTDEEGNEFGFHGVFHDVTPNERIIQTFEFEGLPEPGHVALDTALFEALPGNRSRLRMHSVFQTLEDRDGMVGSGMEWGVRESHARMDELFEALQ